MIPLDIVMKRFHIVKTENPVLTVTYKFNELIGSAQENLYGFSFKQGFCVFHLNTFRNSSTGMHVKLIQTNQKTKQLLALFVFGASDMDA
jgi:hypothetical protein